MNTYVSLFPHLTILPMHLKAIAAFGLLPHNIEDGVDKLSSLCVMPLGPVVASSALSEHEVVGAEDLSEGSGADRVHGAGLQVDEDGTGHIFATWRKT